MTPTKLIRVAAMLVLLGLLVQLVCTFFWTPGAFVIFASLGLGLILAGAALFFFAVWRVLRQTKAL